MAKSSFIEKLNILDGLVIYNDFDIDENVSFEDQWYSYSEDILQIKFGERFVLDVGWYPGSDPKGKFIVYAVLDQNWDNPLMTITCTQLGVLKESIENTVIYINELRKIKNIPFGESKENLDRFFFREIYGEWKSWKPIEEIPLEFYKEAVIDNKKEFYLLFEGAECKKRFSVFFERGVLSYRNADEGSLLQMIGSLCHLYNNAYSGHLFEIANSGYIKWFLRQSSKKYSKEEIKHYVFFTPNDVIEVLSQYEPKVRLENE